jgi:peroxiredoxin/predicted 2-oxoglutarate/Fe(II)-dependent dioxygenase YbiX
MPSYTNLLPGEPAPWFTARATTKEKFVFHTTGGRYLVLCFFATADARGSEAIKAALECPDIFDDSIASFFGVSIDPADEAAQRLPTRRGYRFFWDFAGEICKLYGAIPHDTAAITTMQVRRKWVVLDPTLRVLKVLPFRQGGSDAQELLGYLRSLPPPSRYAGFEVQAPVLILPNVFEPSFCESLIALYENDGGSEGGVMREVEGRTVKVLDHAHKRRRDCEIEDAKVIGQIRQRFVRAVLPELRKAYQYNATRMERYLIGCYRAEDSGHFNAHRDNTTKGTAHRRFAASVNLNSDFDGGEVSFPEYSPRGIKPPPGGAVVFSCSLLHSVSKVTRGRRYALLPFIYDDDAAQIRKANNQFLGDGVVAYASGEESERTSIVP